MTDRGENYIQHIQHFHEYLVTVNMSSKDSLSREFDSDSDSTLDEYTGVMDPGLKADAVNLASDEWPFDAMWIYPDVEVLPNKLFNVGWFLFFPKAGEEEHDWEIFIQGKLVKKVHGEETLVTDRRYYCPYKLNTSLDYQEINLGEFGIKPGAEGLHIMTCIVGYVDDNEETHESDPKKIEITIVPDSDSDFKPQLESQPESQLQPDLE